ncbi:MULTISPECIES: TraR/DksA family transcriptional regulator [unclassified Streptomyces]|uniref:TraR/DksA family transcriptional regulator n=1 Tax=unclassified Streptomyces TaxID=2593676 RepID=UPI001F39459C|nr:MULTISPECIES: TraR/DksA C4-type zinc finger protein [unclassified Streptomyces]MCU4745051.1 TraR/DksA C4-type zinc finger protein [Streptomyces sp. G-5]
MVASDTGDSSDGTPAESGKKTTAKTTKSTRKPAKKTARKSVPEAAAEETAQSAAPAKRTAASRPAKKSTTDETGVKKVAAKNTTTETTEMTEDPAAAVPAARAAAPGELPVRPGEDPWTPQEVAEARSELTGEADRLRTEIAASEDALAGLMRDSGDGAGDDEADTGSKNITREHELALAANAREMLYQTEKALDRLAAGTYGTCEVCGKPIGKARMQAFPRATLCVEDKQRQERRV